MDDLFFNYLIIIESLEDLCFLISDCVFIPQLSHREEREVAEELSFELCLPVLEQKQNFRKSIAALQYCLLI